MHRIGCRVVAGAEQSRRTSVGRAMGSHGSIYCSRCFFPFFHSVLLWWSGHNTTTGRTLPPGMWCVHTTPQDDGIRNLASPQLTAVVVGCRRARITRSGPQQQQHVVALAPQHNGGPPATLPCHWLLQPHQHQHPFRYSCPVGRSWAGDNPSRAADLLTHWKAVVVVCAGVVEEDGVDGWANNAMLPLTHERMANESQIEIAMAMLKPMMSAVVASAGPV